MAHPENEQGAEIPLEKLCEAIRKLNEAGLAVISAEVEEVRKKLAGTTGQDVVDRKSATAVAALKNAKLSVTNYRLMILVTLGELAKPVSEGELYSEIGKKYPEPMQFGTLSYNIGMFKQHGLVRLIDGKISLPAM